MYWLLEGSPKFWIGQPVLFTNWIRSSGVVKKVLDCCGPHGENMYIVQINDDDSEHVVEVIESELTKQVK